MSDERLEHAFAELRAATDVRAPRGLAIDVERAIDGAGFAGAVVAVGRPALVVGALLAAASIALAVTSVRTLAHEAADYALSGGP
jgi:hypothetical protein